MKQFTTLTIAVRMAGLEDYLAQALSVTGTVRRGSVGFHVEPTVNGDTA